MAWIEGREQAGRDKAAQAEADKAALEAESNPEETLTEILKSHAGGKVEPVIEELKGAGYLVRETVPKYLHRGWDTEPQRVAGLSNKYSLVAAEPAPGLTDSSRLDYQVFGMRWYITRITTMGIGQELGTVSLYPLRNARTHYAGVELSVEPSGRYTQPEPINDEDPTQGLRRVIGGWIENAAATE